MKLITQSALVAAFLLASESNQINALETSEDFVVEETVEETVREDSEQQEDDVYGGVTENYETIGLFLYQDFFDTLSSEFLPNLLPAITKISKDEISGSLPLLDQDLVIDYELQDIHIASISIDPTPPIMTINNGNVTFAVQNFAVNLTSDYSYVSDPPIFADIGVGSFLFANTTLSMDVNSTTNPFIIGIDNMKIDSLAEPFCKLDGISDFSQVATNVINTLAAVVRNRVDSFINGSELYDYHTDDKIMAILNKIFGLIDFPINIGKKGLYLDGIFYKDMMPTNNQLYVPLDVMLRYDNATFDSSVCSYNPMYAHFGGNTFDAQITLQDCTVNELLFTLYEANMMHLPLRLAAITTSKLRLLVGKDIITEFGASQPCEIIVSPTALPKIQKHWETFGDEYNPANYWILDTSLTLDIMCQKVNGTGEYEQATTLDLDVSANFNANITYGVTVHFEIYDLDVKYTGFEDSNIKMQSKFLINQEIQFITGVIEGIVEAFFDRGHSFQNILVGTPLCWLDLTEIIGMPNYSEPFMWGGASPKYNAAKCDDGEFTVDATMTDMIKNPEKILTKTLENLKLELKHLLKPGASADDMDEDFASAVAEIEDDVEAELEAMIFDQE